MTTIRTVLFDLDGTLADTAPDLAHALNALLREQGRQPLPYDRIRVEVSHGSFALITLAFGLTPQDEGFAPLRQRLLELYAADLCRETRVFPGIAELIRALQKQNVRWGVVTNKPAFLTNPLMEQLALEPLPVCVVSGDSTTNRKPHPEPMLHACALAGDRPHQCLYVGDAERDIRAGENAGMKTLVALYGYIGENETPEHWGADDLVRSPMEILDWLHDQR